METKDYAIAAIENTRDMYDDMMLDAWSWSVTPPAGKARAALDFVAHHADEIRALAPWAEMSDELIAEAYAEAVGDAVSHVVPALMKEEAGHAIYWDGCEYLIACHEPFYNDWHVCQRAATLEAAIETARS